MSLRIREKLEGKIRDADEYVRTMTELTGEYIDQFTTVPDPRTTDEILAREPKCCKGRPPALTMAKLAKKWKLKPATRKDTSRAKQKHQQQI